MTYDETINFLYAQLPQFQLIGAGAYKPGLQTVTDLEAWAGNPHRNFKCIHVAGTNGKGSTSHLLASVLHEAGYRVGLFTSPHLKDFRERIRIDGQMIPQTAVCDFTQRYLQALEQGKFKGLSCENPSFFELTTVMAFDWFSKQKVDVAVIEVGLGGRLDSTNIITPVLSIITSISFDHVALLGNTLEAIAGEKAGIIKHKVPVVVAKNPQSVYDVFTEKARQEETEIIFSDEVCTISATPCPPGQEFTISSPNLHLYCALGGYYVQENAAAVFAAIGVLRKTFDISDNAIADGFRQVVAGTGIRGRWEILSEHPLCICDTGHNEAGIRYVAQQLAATTHNRLHIVIGVVSDKDVTHILALLPKDATYYFTQASVPRALPATELALKAATFSLKGNCYDTVSKAYDAACQAAADDDLIFIGGSNFTVAEIL